METEYKVVTTVRLGLDAADKAKLEALASLNERSRPGQARVLIREAHGVQVFAGNLPPIEGGEE